MNEPVTEVELAEHIANSLEGYWDRLSDLYFSSPLVRDTEGDVALIIDVTNESTNTPNSTFALKIERIS